MEYLFGPRSNHLYVQNRQNRKETVLVMGRTTASQYASEVKLVFLLVAIKQKSSYNLM